MRRAYRGRERRKFARLNYATPLDYKVCKKKTISKLLKGYTSNISQAGLLCNIKERVKKNDVLWLSFDRGTLSVCENIEKKSLIYQNGIIAKVVRVKQKGKNTYDVGVRFLTRQEKNLTHIYPKIYFLKNKMSAIESEEEPEEELEQEPQEEEQREVWQAEEENY